MTIAAIFHLIENDLSYPEGSSFAAILGAAPSKGARSPMLWNAAFEAHGVMAQMLPMDVTTGNLTALLEGLQANPDFVGGAIAMPHKEAVAHWLGDRLTSEARAIGAVNCLYRDASGRLAGTNTDGEAARAVLEEQFGSMDGKSILLLGPGGAGKAVAAYLAAAAGSVSMQNHARSGLMIASRRTLDPQIAQRLGVREVILWNDIDQVLSWVDVVVNCTPLGTGTLVEQSPLSVRQLFLLAPHAVVYDINYQPAPTRLLILAQTRGLSILDGAGMNLEQAILAYGHAAPQPRGVTTTRSAMEMAKQHIH